MNDSTIKASVDGEFTSQEIPEPSGWQCYLWGSTPDNPAMVYRPSKGAVPNWIGRLMMRWLLDCRWVKDKELT